MKTPSIGLDQNREKRSIDKYWGRVPMYLHRIQETIGTNKEVIVVNPEFAYLFNQELNSTLTKENISIELYNDIVSVIDLIPQYGITPMPEYDAFFDYVGITPGSGGCPVYMTKNPSGGCSVYRTSCRVFTVKQ